jgi:hypothetical protein
VPPRSMTPQRSMPSGMTGGRTKGPILRHDGAPRYGGVPLGQIPCSGSPLGTLSSDSDARRESAVEGIIRLKTIGRSAPPALIACVQCISPLNLTRPARNTAIAQGKPSDELRYFEYTVR